MLFSYAAPCSRADSPFLSQICRGLLLRYIEDNHVQSSNLSEANLSGQECMTAAFMLKLAQVNGWRGGWEQTYPILYRIDKKPD